MYLVEKNVESNDFALATFVASAFVAFVFAAFEFASEEFGFRSRSGSEFS